MCKSTRNGCLYLSVRAFWKLLANLELLQALHASEKPNSRFPFFSAPTHQMGLVRHEVLHPFSSCLHDIALQCTGLQSWNITFKKFNRIIRRNGGRLLIFWRQTLLADSPHCGICSTKETGRDMSSFSEGLSAEGWHKQTNQSYDMLFNCSVSFSVYSWALKTGM